MIQYFLFDPAYSEYYKDTNKMLLLDGTQLLMKNNCIEFNDTHWLQKIGTAMGMISPGATYATLYFAIRELTLLPAFQTNVPF
jgi:hypothetical protein